MGVRAERRAASAKKLPGSIATRTELEAHLQALARIEPQFAIVHSVAGEVPLRQTQPGFHGLFQIITSQQISAAAGKAIFARCEKALGPMTAQCLAEINDAALKAAGLSAPKIRTLRAASTAILNGDLDLETLTSLEAEEAIAHLSAVKGIGRWTAEVYLLFALGHTDIFPAGDLALKEGVRIAFGLEERPAEKELITRAEDWRPHRSAAARLVWAYYGAVKRGANAVPV